VEAADHPHSSMTGLNHAATIHFLAAIDNGGYFEGDVSRAKQVRDELVSNPGTIARRPLWPLERPGLGARGQRGVLSAYPAIEGARLYLTHAQTLLACSPAPLVVHAQGLAQQTAAHIRAFPARGLQHTLARHVASELPKSLGQASSSTTGLAATPSSGTDARREVPADGYTLLWRRAAFSVIQSLYKTSFASPRTSRPSRWRRHAQCWSRTSRLPFNDVQGLIAYAKSKPRKH